MRKLLIPCDGSINALRAVHYALALAKEIPDVQVELLNIQEPSLVREHAILSMQEIERLHTEDANRILQPAKKIFDAEGVSCQAHHRTGSPASEIAQHVHEAQCDAIIMGSRGLSQITGLMLGSVTTRVIHLVHVPVTIVK